MTGRDTTGEVSVGECAAETGDWKEVGASGG